MEAVRPLAHHGATGRVRDCNEATVFAHERCEVALERALERVGDVRDPHLIAEADVLPEEDILGRDLDTRACRLRDDARGETAVGIEVADTPAVNEDDELLASGHAGGPPCRGAWSRSRPVASRPRAQHALR
jgi:hypothetical protein